MKTDKVVKNIGGRRKIIPTHPTEFWCFPTEKIPRNFSVRFVWSLKITAPTTEVQAPTPEVKVPSTGVQVPPTGVRASTAEVQAPTEEVLLPTTEVQLPSTEEDVLAEALRTQMNLESQETAETDPTNPNQEEDLEASGSSLEGTSSGTRPKSTQKK
jgi:hypothetical protein